MVSRKTTVGILSGVVVLGLACAFFPPFRIVSLDAVRKQREQEAFQPRAFAESFWNGDLANSLDRATAAGTLLAMIRTDPAAAKKQYGRTAELGNVYYYFVHGVGHVIAVGDEHVSVVLTSSDRRAHADVILATANIFGNAIRNATGLLDVNRFANSQDFNNISQELNRLAEVRVLSPFNEAVSVGATVRFVGCAEVEDEDRDLDPLKIVPVLLAIDPSRDSGETVR